MLLLLLKEVYIFSNNVYGPWASHCSYCTEQRQCNTSIRLTPFPPSQKAQYHFHSFSKQHCNPPHSCRVQTSVLHWTYTKENRICISISGNAWFAKFLAWLNGWTAHFISLGISNSSVRSTRWQNDRCEKVSSHILPLRFQQWCRSERLYSAKDSSQKGDGIDKSPALSSSSLIIKNSSAVFGNSHNLLWNCTLH